jgi:hypothetical protein
LSGPFSSTHAVIVEYGHLEQWTSLSSLIRGLPESLSNSGLLIDVQRRVLSEKQSPSESN